MKKPLITAAVWAAFAVGCERAPVTPPVATPVIPSLATQPKPIVIELSTSDAGAFTATAEEPVGGKEVDALALEHDSPGVDHEARAQQLKTDGDFVGALVESRRALFGHEHDTELLTLTADLAQRTRRFDLAATAHGRVCDDNFDDALPCLREARAWLKANDAEAALEAAQTAALRDDGNPEVHQAAGLAQLKLGNLPQAIASFEKVLELKPDHGYAMNNLGLAYLRSNQNEKAVKVLEGAAQLLPHLAYVHNNLGVALERTGQAEAARDAYFVATSLSPKYVKARVNAARVAKAAVEIDEDGAESLSDLPHAMPEPQTMP